MRITIAPALELSQIMRGQIFYAVATETTLERWAIGVYCWIEPDPWTKLSPTWGWMPLRFFDNHEDAAIVFDAVAQSENWEAVESYYVF